MHYIFDYEMRLGDGKGMANFYSFTRLAAAAGAGAAASVRALLEPDGPSRALLDSASIPTLLPTGPSPLSLVLAARASHSLSSSSLLKSFSFSSDSVP